MWRTLSIIILCTVGAIAQQRAITPTVALHFIRHSADSEHTLFQEQQWIDVTSTAIAQQLDEHFQPIRLGGTDPYLSADYIVDLRYALIAKSWMSVKHSGSFKKSVPGAWYHIRVEARLINAGSKQVVASCVIVRTFEQQWSLGEPHIEFDYVLAQSLKLGKQIGKQLLDIYLHNLQVTRNVTVALHVEPEFYGEQYFHYKPSYDAIDSDSDIVVSTVEELGYLPFRSVIHHSNGSFDLSLSNDGTAYVGEMQQLRSKIARELMRSDFTIVERTRLEEAQNEQLRSEAGLVDKRVATVGLLGDIPADLILVGDPQSGIKLIERKTRRIVGIYTGKAGSTSISGGFLPQRDNRDDAKDIVRKLNRTYKRSQQLNTFLSVNIDLHSKREYNEGDNVFIQLVPSVTSNILERKLGSHREPIYAGHIQVGEYRFAGDLLIGRYRSKQGIIDDVAEDALWYVALNNRVAQHLLLNKTAQVFESHQTFELEQEDKRVVSNLVDNSVQNPLYSKHRTHYSIRGYADFSQSLSNEQDEYAVVIQVVDATEQIVATKRFVYCYPKFDKLCDDVAHFVERFLAQEQAVNGQDLSLN